jgi:hypothetical protein
MNFIWRIVIAALAFVFLVTVVPLFLQVIGLTVGGPLLQLLKLCLAAGCVAYVIWGPHTWPFGAPHA